MIITIDTNIIISALGWKGPEFNLMNIIFDEKLDLAISPQIIEEFINVAKSKKFDFSDDDIDEYVDALLKISKIVFPEETVDVILDDPADNRILECAEISNSEYIIAGNNHLLNLKKYKNIRIIKTSNFLKNILKL